MSSILLCLRGFVPNPLLAQQSIAHDDSSCTERIPCILIAILSQQKKTGT